MDLYNSDNELIRINSNNNRIYNLLSINDSDNDK